MLPHDNSSEEKNTAIKIVAMLAAFVMAGRKSPPSSGAASAPCSAGSCWVPVRRPQGRLRSAVIASTSDLAAWLAAAPKRELEAVANLEATVEQLRRENAALRQQLAEARVISAPGLSGIAARE